MTKSVLGGPESLQKSQEVKLSTGQKYGSGKLQGRAMKQMGVSKNYGTPKSSILIGFSIVNHPF